MWQSNVVFVFVITYLLQEQWLCVLLDLIADHQPVIHPTTDKANDVSI